MGKSQAKLGRPRGRVKVKTVAVRLSQEVYDALDRLCAETRRSRSAEVSLVLENHLRQQGKLP